MNTTDKLREVRDAWANLNSTRSKIYDYSKAWVRMTKAMTDFPDPDAVEAALDHMAHDERCPAATKIGDECVCGYAAALAKLERS